MKGVYLIFAFLYTCSFHSFAQVNIKEANQLGHALTPIGAQKEGTIPQWTGGLTPKSIKDGKYDDPFINEKPVFIITSKNAESYSKQLSSGINVETLDQTRRPRQVWGYDSAQRRVRRFPHVDFDNPALLAENLRTTDDTDMYNGSPTHFQWYIRGKKEMYIPYNNYKLSDSGVPLTKVLTPYHLNPEYTRFELHRVWVIEGILKLQYRHIYSRRTFYIDEDSWSIVMADQYDQSDNLWRVSLAYLKNFYDVPLIYPAASVFHDLKKQRYHFQGLTNGEASRGNFTSPPPPKSKFTPAGLRAGIRR